MDPQYIQQLYMDLLYCRASVMDYLVGNDYRIAVELVMGPPATWRTVGSQELSRIQLIHRPGLDRSSRGNLNTTSGVTQSSHPTLRERFAMRKHGALRGDNKAKPFMRRIKKKGQGRTLVEGAAKSCVPLAASSPH
jgi:hypothetical protein